MSLLWRFIAAFGKDDHHRITAQQLVDIDEVILAGVAGAIPKVKNKCGADLGCGTGDLASRLATYFQTFIATDLTDSVRPSHRSNFLFHKMDLLRPTLEENSLDFIIINSVLQVFSKKDAATVVRNLIPLLREGGTLVLGEVPFEERYYERSISWRLIFSPYVFARWVYVRLFCKYTWFDRRFFENATANHPSCIAVDPLDQRHPYFGGCFNVIIRKKSSEATCDPK